MLLDVPTPAIDAWLAEKPGRKVLFDDEARAATGWPKHRQRPCLVVLAEDGRGIYGLGGDSRFQIVMELERLAMKRAVLAAAGDGRGSKDISWLVTTGKGYYCDGCQAQRSEPEALTPPPVCCGSEMLRVTFSRPAKPGEAGNPCIVPL